MGESNEPRPNALDYRLLFQSSPRCALVLDRDLRITDATGAFLKATGTTRAIVGRGLFDVFLDDPDDASAAGMKNLRASLERVLVEARPDTMPSQRFHLRRPEPEGDLRVVRVWSSTNHPAIVEGGRVTQILCDLDEVAEDVASKREIDAEEAGLQGFSLQLEKRFGRLLDTAPDAMVVVGADGRIDLVNVQTERLFGYSRAELLGKPLEILIPERFRGGHHGHLSRFFKTPAARSMGSGLELWGRRKDGVELPIEVSLSPLETDPTVSVSAAIRDISDRRRMEAAAKLVSDRLVSAVDSIQDAFALFDVDDRLVLCNSVYRRLLAESVPGQLVGRPFKELFEAWSAEIDFPSAEAREEFRRERLARRLHEQTTTFDVRMRDGRRLRVIDRRTAEGGVVKTVWDLTDDERLAADLREARVAAEAASAAKSEFLASMSHELRTPLNAVLGFAQLLQRDKKEPLSTRHRDRVDQILKGGEHLLRLIDDILDLARIEAGGISISTEPVSVSDVLDELKRTLEPMASRQGIELAIEPLPTNLSMASADRTRLVQILMNLGSNAIKYNRPSGSVSFAVSTPDPERVRVTVRDTGYGIPADRQDKLFQPFQRAGQETGPIEGTGIGLVITKRLAQLMKGDVGFRSVAAKGSEFWIDIPAHAAALPSAGPVLDALGGPGRLAQAGTRTILYVEDNPANVTFMRDLTSSFENIELLTAPNAEIGVELARKRLPEVIIMDINLPGMSGLDALRALRERPETKALPVIALTAAASERDKERGMQAGFHGYLTKPVKVDELIDVLEKLLASSSQ